MSQLSCPYCKYSPLIRVHKGDQVYCSNCNEPLLRDVNSSDIMSDRYIKCQNPSCGYEGEETVNPKHGDQCPRCGVPLL